MSITELDLYCRDIATSYKTSELMGLRVRFQQMKEDNKISYGLYKGLVRDIRRRADWLANRGGK